MVNMTLAVPENLQAAMKQFPEINWSEVARQAFRERVEKFLLLEKLAQKSKLTEKDAFELGDIVKKNAWEKIKKDLVKKGKWN